jgi:hypothetical protein
MSPVLTLVIVVMATISVFLLIRWLTFAVWEKKDREKRGK